MKKILQNIQIFRIALLIGAMTLSTSCNKFVEDYEISPNEPLKVTPQLLLTSAQAYMFNSTTGGLARFASILVQSHAGMERQYAGHDVYRFVESDVDNEWNDLYAGTLMDIEQLIQLTSKDKPYYAGIAKIMKAHSLGIATDCWGDIPNSEAFQGLNGTASPKYDSQESVYKDIQKLLDEGIALLSIPESDIPIVIDNIPGKDDVIFEGDLKKWIITAHILKARHYNHLSKIDPTGSATNALASVQAALAAGANSSSDMYAKFTSSQTNANFWYLFQQNRSGDLGIGSYFLDTLVNSNDPRLPKYVYTWDGVGYLGYPAGGPGNSADNSISMAEVTPEMPLQMVTFKELKFIEAEANFRIGNKDAAATAYNKGLEEALSIAEQDSTVDNYLDNYKRDASNIELKDIMFQKYLALFQQIEVWTDYRRTDLPTLKPANTRTLADFPRSFPTAQSENTRNVNVKKNTSVTTRVWWDK